jgi:A/G-specific adenine glycosylase
VVGSETGLIEWWERHGRHDLPWRATRDPWAVLVSELMLQQTQVPRVEPRWRAFVERFPTPAACAAATAGDVVRAWAGLGYNRRAVNLHRCAVAVVERHGGVLPGTLAELLALPGIGPYTARAVLVFAFDEDLGLVDTNAGRFVARALAGRAVTPKEAQVLADAAVPPGDAWRWGSAVFDLGALICAKRVPRCDACPLRDRGCAWAAAGFPEPDPVHGSAGISAPQSRFDGSDRQGRGRLVDRLRRAPVAAADLAAVMGWPDDHTRAARVAASLLDDGLAAIDDEGRFTLPA